MLQDRTRHRRRPFPRTCHLSRLLPLGQSARFRRTNPAQGQGCRQICQLSRVSHLSQELRTLRSLSGQAVDCPQRQVHSRRRLHGCHLHAPERCRECRRLLRNLFDRRADTPNPPVHRKRHRHLRQRPRRHQGIPARHRPAPGRGPQHKGHALARGRGPRLFRPVAHIGGSGALSRRQ